MGNISQVKDELSQNDISLYINSVDNIDVLRNAFTEKIGGETNIIYYINRLNNFDADLKMMIGKADVLPTTVTSLISFNTSLYAFLYSTLNFLFHLSVGSVHQVNLSSAKAELRNILVSLNEIRRMESHIKFNRLQKSNEDLFYLKQFCDFHFEEALEQLKFFTVDLMQSPLRDNLNEIRTIFSNSIDFSYNHTTVKTSDLKAVSDATSNLKFSDLVINIHGDAKKEFIDEFRSIIYLEKSMKFSLAIAVLVEGQVLKVPNNSFKKLYEILKLEFSWGIGSYFSMQQHFSSFTKGTIDSKLREGEVLENMKIQIGQLINRHKAES